MTILAQTLNRFSQAGSLFLSSLIFMSCSLRSPGLETPPPSETNSDKAFFVDASGKPKTFLCGYASETEIGWIGESVTEHNIPLIQHCNVQFEITEKSLNAKMVNPSFLNDPSRWQTILAIPILSHYYSEPEKDTHGRETNRIIENSSRSHWSARPNMKLDLQNVTLTKSGSGGVGVGAESAATTLDGFRSALEDIEWDRQNNFLAFTITNTNQTFGSDNQAKIRFNFLKFDHNEQFRKTPFSDKNYRYMNVLHVIGEKVNGIYPVLHAAHWDLTQPHEIILNNFPEQYIPLAKTVIDDWNKAYQKVKAVPPGFDAFIPVVKNLSHSFDMRVSSINWVSDVRIAAAGGGVLGVGEAVADVSNGEIKWAGITLYGGLIENYIKSYLPLSTSTDMLAKQMNLSQLLFDTKALAPSLNLPPQIANFSQMAQSLSSNDFEKFAKSMAAPTARSSKPTTPQIGVDRGPSPDMIRNMIGEMRQFSQKQIARSGPRSVNFNFTNLISPQLQKYARTNDQKENSAQLKTEDRLGRIANYQMHSNVFDMDRRIEDVAGGWAKAMTSSKLSYNDVVRSVVKELISHEYGHIMGLGHQFKANILPDPTRVPEQIYKELKAKANQESQFTNMTSIMGYRNPRSEIGDAETNIKPGAQDELVLAYLYNQKFATFKAGDSEFSFVDVPQSGIIPGQDPARADYVTSYFPQCNDLDASYSFDPYCNRFAQGNTASELVTNYLKDLSENLITKLNAFTDSRGGDPSQAEMRLWQQAQSTMGRIRLFYDYMRMKYASQIDQIRNDESALYEFSRACKSDQISNPKLAEILKNNVELRELCQSNKIALDGIIHFISLSASDYTKMDMSNSYTPGGMTGGEEDTRDYSHVVGTWTELSALGLKISSMFALTTPKPWVFSFGFAIPKYDTPDAGYSYFSLYPREYTEAISSAVTHNIQFASLDSNHQLPRIGTLTSTIGYFDSLADQSNDSARFPKNYIDRIRSQSKFNFNIVAVILKAQQKEKGGFQRFDRFETSVFDFVTGKSTQASYAYLLPDGQVIVRAQNMLLLPVTKFQPYQDSEGYVLAYRLDYFEEHNDLLTQASVKQKLLQFNDQVLASCIEGPPGTLNGLGHYFNSDFAGFYMPKGLLGQPQWGEFLDSISENFTSYYNDPRFKIKPRPEACTEALRDLGLIVSTAALINNNWIPGTEEYFQK
jgi:hypothetical protein